MKKENKILITGGKGLVATALYNCLIGQGYKNVKSIDIEECDLTDYKATIEYFEKYQPEYVFHLAGAIFGIMGNMKNKAISFLCNTLINTHVVEASHRVKVQKIVAMGTGCVYPYPSPGLPLKEDMVWLGAPHEAENSYAHSKRAMLAQLNAYKESYNMDFSFVISANLYGPNDKFDINYGHVVPSLVRKFYEAKNSGTSVVIWGNGSAKRDFLYSSDMANALVLAMHKVSGPVNIGSGNIYSIKDIVVELANYTNMLDKIEWDATKPNGQDYRSYCLDKIFLAGFRPSVTMQEGLRQTYDWYVANSSEARK
ncbi:MAG: NAD-dependent epimerase/dehydratase family protein [Gammaproteobacteria bacterium]